MVMIDDDDDDDDDDDSLKNEPQFARWLAVCILYSHVARFHHGMAMSRVHTLLGAPPRSLPSLHMPPRRLPSLLVEVTGSHCASQDNPCLHRQHPARDPAAEASFAVCLWDCAQLSLPSLSGALTVAILR